MTIPAWVKPAGWGAAGGALVLAIVGFSAGWVVWSGTAAEMASSRADKAVIVAMTPICVAQFNGAAKAAMAPNQDREVQLASRGAMLAALEKQDAWKRGDFVTRQGWATMPGSTKSNPEVASACADALMKLAEAKK